MAVKEINSAGFAAEVLQSDKPVLVDFYATWCGPCKMLRPTLEALSDDRQDVNFVSIDVDDARDLAMEYNVSSIPCVVLFKDGKEADRSVGLVPREVLEDFLG